MMLGSGYGIEKCRCLYLGSHADLNLSARGELLVPSNPVSARGWRHWYRGVVAVVKDILGPIFE